MSEERDIDKIIDNYLDSPEVDKLIDECVDESVITPDIQKIIDYVAPFLDEALKEDLILTNLFGNEYTPDMKGRTEKLISIMGQFHKGREKMK